MRNLFDTALWRPPATISGNATSVRLREHDSGASLRELVITGVPPDATIIDLDPVEGMGAGKRARLKRYSWFFSPSHALAAKQCDGCLSFADGGSEILVLIELKSSASLLAKGRKQLEAGRAFAGYIQALRQTPLKVVTRLVFVGPPQPAPLIGKLSLKEHREIPVTLNSNRAYLTFNQMVW